jgi:RND family efflux transporter MFP subunit
VRRTLGLLALGLALGACGEKPAEKKPGPPPTLITVTQAKAQALEIVETTLGSLEAVQDPRIAAEVAGRILRLTIRAGEAVKKGQLLAEIDPTDVAQQHKADRADIARIEALFAQQERLVTRQSELVQKSFISKNALDDASAQRDALKNQLEGARARAALSANNLQKTKIAAPFDGIVEEQIAAQGDYLKVGDPVLRLVSNTRLRAHLPFPEAAAHKYASPARCCRARRSKARSRTSARPSPNPAAPSTSSPASRTPKVNSRAAARSMPRWSSASVKQR